jgi:hypothetical protein
MKRIKRRLKNSRNNIKLEAKSKLWQYSFFVVKTLLSKNISLMLTMHFQNNGLCFATWK